MNAQQLLDQHSQQCTARAAAIAEWTNISERLQLLARTECVALRDGSDDLLDRIALATTRLEERRDELETLLLALA